MAPFGGSDWVECTGLCILIASSLVTLSLIFMLLYFQVRLFGVNCRCLRKTKTYSIVLMLGFNICLTIDLLRYELVSYLGTTILNLLEFAFKYASIIALSKFYISRSGEIMKRCEKKKVQKRLKCAVILAFLLLLLITIFKAEIYL